MKLCANCEAAPAVKHKTECGACRAYRHRHDGVPRPQALIVIHGWRRWEALQEQAIVRRAAGIP